MKTTLIAAAALTAALGLSACGHSNNAGDAASTENVEMPAEEAMSGVDATATPVADPSANLSDSADSDSSDSAAASPAGSAAAPAAKSPAAKSAPIRM